MADRPLGGVYPVVFFDGIVFNSRKDNKIIAKCVYSVLGINMDGPAPGVYPLEDTGEVEKKRISLAALHRISCSCVWALSSVALFRCIFNSGTFFGFIRVYTVIFSDPASRCQ